MAVGTFNLNNLFSRFNFRAHVDEIPEESRDLTVSFEFTEEGDYWFRTFRGRLIQPMPAVQARALADRGLADLWRAASERLSPLRCAAVFPVSPNRTDYGAGPGVLLLDVAVVIAHGLNSEP